MRIVFIALANSTHTARWIEQLADQDWDIHLFPVEDTSPHPLLRNLTLHNFINERVSPEREIHQTGLTWPFKRGRTRIRQIAEFISRGRLTPPARLARAIQGVRPDVVHILEMQRAGYLFLDSRRFLDDKDVPPVLYSSWGSDLYHFGRDATHQNAIKAFLAQCDYYIADCERDMELVRDFAFRGTTLGVFPGGGGFDIDEMRELGQVPIEDRKIIALKGYQSDDWGGRALIAIEALSLCARELKDYEVIIYSATPEVARNAQELANRTGLRFTVMPHSRHSEIIKLFGRARIAIALGTTDGTPNAMLEAMIMGAFPIQSDTISTREWLVDGENGFLVPPEEPTVVAEAIRRALSNVELLKNAEKVNARVTRDRLDRSDIKKQVLKAYARARPSTRTYRLKQPIINTTKACEF